MSDKANATQKVANIGPEIKMPIGAIPKRKSDYEEITTWLDKLKIPWRNWGTRHGTSTIDDFIHLYLGGAIHLDLDGGISVYNVDQVLIEVVHVIGKNQRSLHKKFFTPKDGEKQKFTGQDGFITGTLTYDATPYDVAKEVLSNMFGDECQHFATGSFEFKTQGYNEVELGKSPHFHGLTVLSRQRIYTCSIVDKVVPDLLHVSDNDGSVTTYGWMT